MWARLSITQRRIVTSYFIGVGIAALAFLATTPLQNYDPAAETPPSYGYPFAWINQQTSGEYLVDWYNFRANLQAVAAVGVFLGP